ncbi:hypothetical protein BDR04DRAFT_1154656 [Suillus decipiens]|nr:hypothetical protein BDR04DRAFT_1154656 [Suillus decipiens]
MSLNNLAFSLRERFQQRGVSSDLDEAIVYDRAALFLRPPGHPARFDSLNNLALDLATRFTHVLSDINEAIEYDRATLFIRLPGHPARFDSLNNLALDLATTFTYVPSDVDEAIALNRDALSLCPHGHPDRAMALDNLAISLGNRSKQRGIPSDLDEAIELHLDALLLRIPGHSERSSSLCNLALNLQRRFERSGLSPDLEESFIHFSELSKVPCAVSRNDLHAAKSWVISAEAMNHSSVLFAYKTTLLLLDKRVAALSFSSHHFDVVREAISSIATDAFSCSIRHDSLTTAVELVEQGRAVFWTHLARFRSPLDRVSLSGNCWSPMNRRQSRREVPKKPRSEARGGEDEQRGTSASQKEAYQRLALMSAEVLRHSQAPADADISSNTGAALAEEFKQLSFRLRDEFDRSTEDRSPEIRQLIIQWDDVASRIRMLPDFSRFLLPPLFSDLQKVAEAGPVIIVNASKYSCDALIILNGQDPIHVPLDTTQAKVTEFSSEMQSLAEQFGSSDHQFKLVGILRKLWDMSFTP